MNARARRITRRLAAVLAILLALFYLAHTGPAMRFAGRLVERGIERIAGGAASIGAFEYRLWRGELRAAAFSWSSESISLATGEVEIALSRPVSVHIDAPRVSASLGGSGEPASGFTLPRALLGLRVDVENGSFLLGERLELQAIRLHLEPGLLSSKATLEAARGLLRHEGIETAFGPASAGLELRPDEILLERARVERDGSFLIASGRIGPLSPLAAELSFRHSLEAGLLEMVEARGRLDGEGTLRYEGGAFTADGVARSEAFALEPLDPVGLELPWRFGDGVLRVDGRIDGYGGRIGVEAQLDVEASTQTARLSFEGLEAERVAPFVASRASGELSLSARGFDRSTAAGEGAIRLHPKSRVREPSLPLQGEIAVRLDAGAVRLDAPSLRAPGLEIAAWGALDESVSARFRIRAPELERSEDLLALAGFSPSPIPLAGAVVVDGTATGTPDRIAISASLSGEGLTVAETPVELTGSVSFRDARVELQQVRLFEPDQGGSLVVEGAIPLDPGAGAWSLSARASGLELAWASALAPIGVTGTLEGELHVEGDHSRPDLRGSFEARDVTVGDLFQGELRGDARLRGPLASLAGEAHLGWRGARARGVELPDALLSLDSDGELARIEARFEDGTELLHAELALEPPYPIEAEVPLENLPFAEIRRMVPLLEEAGAELEIAGKARIEASLWEAESFRYQIDVDRIFGVYREIALGATAPFSIAGDRQSLAVRDLTLVGEDTAIGLDGVIPLSRDGGIVLHARGATRLEILRPWFPELDLAGRANVEVRVEGALPDPWLRGEISIEEASARYGELSATGVFARAEWTDRALRIEEVTGEILDGRFRLEGELPPQLDAAAPVRIRFHAEELNPLSLLPSAPALEGAALRVSASGELSGAGADLSTWQGSGHLQSLTLRARDYEIRSEAPAPWSLDDGSVALSGLRLAQGEAQLLVEALARPFERPLFWTATVSGRIDHAISRIFLADLGWTFTGATEIQIRAESTGAGAEEPFRVEGRGAFQNARLVMRDPAIAFTNMEGELELRGTAIAVTKLTADAGGGKVSAEGEVGLEAIDLRATAQSVRLNYPEGLRSEISGSVALQGSPESLRLAGDLSLERALFSRDINLESEILSSLSEVGRLSAQEGFASRVALDLRVRAGEAFRIDNNLARMEASVNLAVGGTLDAPEISGIASVRPGGRFRFGGNTYRVEAGRIELRGYPREPVQLDIAARTSVGEYDIRLGLRGPTDDLQTELTSPSHPEIPQGDVASLLLTGRRLGEISGAGRALVGERMVSYVGSTLADLAELGIGEALPFDIVTAEPSLIAGEVDPGARFTLGARFSDELSVVYSIGLDDAENQIWLVDYELPRSMRTQIIRNQENEFTFGLSQELRFDIHDHGRGREATRPTVASVSVSFRGEVPAPSEEQLRERLKVRRGDRFDYWKAWEEAEKLRRDLQRQDYLEAVVDVAATPAEGELVALEYSIELGPRVRFEWEGDEPDDSLKRALREAWTGGSTESFLTADLALLAEGRLYEKGYYLAAAEVTAERGEEHLLVTVALERGPRGKRVSVDFVGNEFFADSALLRLLPRPASAAFHELVTSKRPRLKQLLSLEYASAGFVTVAIGDPELSFSETEEELRVAIPIAEGERFLVDAIELEGVESVDQAELRSRLALRENEPFRVTGFVQDRSAVASFYRDRGFPDVKVSSEVVERPGAAELGVRLLVEEGPRVTVAGVTVEGNQETRESVIRREVALEPGQPLRISQVSETQRRLYELGIFQSAEVVVEGSRSQETSRDVRIAVTEVPDLEFDYGARGSTDGFFEALTELRAPNLFGRAQHASMRALLGTERRIFRFTYHSPYLSRFRIATDFFVERSIEEEAATEEAFGFADRSWTFTAQQTRPLSRQLSLQWSYSFRRVVIEIDDPSDLFDTSLTQNNALLTGALVGDHRDSLVRPSRGSLWSLTFQGSPTQLGSELTFVKLFGQLFTFVPLGRGVVWASGYRVGVANSFGQRLTVDDGFRAGGPNSVRGFEQDALLPEDDRGPRGGAGLLVFNQEIRFPLFWRLRGVGFHDAGNSFPDASDIRLGDLRQSLGMGARLELPFGLLRLDLARAIDRRLDEKAWRWIVSLGHAF